MSELLTILSLKSSGLYTLVETLGKQCRLDGTDRYKEWFDIVESDLAEYKDMRKVLRLLQIHFEDGFYKG